MLRYDLVVIGGGAGGFVASKLAAGIGKKVLLIEKDKLGGECTWSGCVPSKALIKAAKTAHSVKNAKKFHINLDIEDFYTSGVMQYARDVVKEVYSGHLPETFTELGIDLEFGSPVFTSRNSVEVNGSTFIGKKIIIATGSSPLIPSIPGMDKTHYLTNKNLFTLEVLPDSMIILGGGPVGVEMACALNRLNVRVTIVEAAGRILINEDEELALLLQERMKNEGITILTDTKAFSVSGEENLTRLSIEKKVNGRRVIEAQKLLICVGRIPNTNGLHLQDAGVSFDSKGIKTDSFLQTTNPDIYACGDVTGPYRFSHIAEYQAKTAVMNAFLPVKRRMNYTNIGWCTFTDPEFARIGMTEREAREQHGGNISVYRHKCADTDRGKTDGDKFGMSKFITDPAGKLIGGHILSPSAGELIHLPLMAKTVGKPFKNLYNMIHIYPTYTDLVKQPAKTAFIQSLERNPFVRLMKKFRSKKG
jgi:pyruvate/2-oxoglutarate dehydrogenase complex dihydrolipoamide dehydrogenase (E3) component